MARVCHFEIHADDPEKAITFYQQVFGWEFNRWGSEEYWLIRTGPASEPGIDGGLIRRRGAGPIEGQAVNAFVCTATVPSVDSYFARAQKLGGTVALPKMAIPGVGYVAYCKDPDGNIFGLHQPDPSAK